MAPVEPDPSAGAHATAEVEERQLLKAMSWWDGFMIALANPGFLVAALGGSIAGLGTTGALVLWLISVLLGSFQNNIYAELATMFPEKSGGIAVYAHEAWRRYFSPIGPLATFGYWFAWSTVLSISGLICGTLITAEFFPSVTFEASGGHFHIDLPVTIAIVMLLLVWVFNARGIRSTVWFSYVTGILLMIPLLVMMLLPYLTGDWHSANMTWEIGNNGGIALALTWLYFMGWSAYGFEACATVAPEYRDTATDTPKALRASAAFSVVVYALLPLGLGGTLGTEKVAADKTAIVFYKDALDAIAGNVFGGVLVVCMIAGIVLTMSTATLDGSRALYGIAKDGMTIKWFGYLNKHRVPGRGMALDALMNIFLVVFFGSAIEILAAGNLGYMAAHFFALSGFLLLRKDRPAWPRPIKLSAVWMPIAAILAAANLVFIVCGGFIFADTYGYGLSKTLIGATVLIIALVLYFYRRTVQDRLPMQWREPVPAVPSQAANAEAG
ncbi:MAG TPA: APC family permease [Pseudonocardia sp.]|jgi:amino acid transporter|uniref:APC family permease n=1 Tax=Pseudonocardia sp. TaxID=60912 RepID=UPI002EDBB371